VVAVDLEDDKLEMARELGADYVVNAAEQDPAEEIQKLGGADAAIALAVAPRPFEQAFDSLARGGTLVMVALPPDNYVKLPIFERCSGGSISRARSSGPTGTSRTCTSCTRSVVPGCSTRPARSKTSTRRSTTSCTRATRRRASSSRSDDRPATETTLFREVSI
jgi:NADPH:quinone reductase-like Zn-dependent oxidoreductase